MNEHKLSTGHLAAVVTILLWGTTFIATKLLLDDYSPAEILFYRFLIGFAALLLAYPHLLKFEGLRREVYYIGAGLCGVTLYYLLENIALTYTYASNISVLLSVTPFFTAILARLFLKETLSAYFFAGFVIAIIGIGLICFNGSRLALSPVGDVLAILAAVVWSCYSILTKKIATFGHHTILTTRRIFAYGLLLMLPSLLFFNFRFDPARLMEAENLFNMIYLGVGASAICFVTWNLAVKVLGAITTSVYLYLIPVITVIAARLILHETITPLAIAGTALIIAGLLVSGHKPKRKA